ncbi:MAG: hypothetical protein RSB53_04120, partial [Oscillospiraceae bacterium]
MCALARPKSIFLFLREKKNRFQFEKEKKPKGRQAPPLETPEVSEVEAQPLVGSIPTQVSTS